MYIGGMTIHYVTKIEIKNDGGVTESGPYSLKKFKFTLKDGTTFELDAFTCDGQSIEIVIGK